MTPFEVKTSRPSHGSSHKSSDFSSNLFIGFDVVVGNLNQGEKEIVIKDFINTYD